MLWREGGNGRKLGWTGSIGRGQKLRCYNVADSDLAKTICGVNITTARFLVRIEACLKFVLCLIFFNTEWVKM